MLLTFCFEQCWWCGSWTKGRNRAVVLILISFVWSWSCLGRYWRCVRVFVLFYFFVNFFYVYIFICYNCSGLHCFVFKIICMYLFFFVLSAMVAGTFEDEFFFLCCSQQCKKKLIDMTMKVVLLLMSFMWKIKLDQFDFIIIWTLVEHLIWRWALSSSQWQLFGTIFSVLSRPTAL